MKMEILPPGNNKTKGSSLEPKPRALGREKKNSNDLVEKIITKCSCHFAPKRPLIGTGLEKKQEIK